MAVALICLISLPYCAGEKAETRSPVIQDIKTRVRPGTEYSAPARTHAIDDSRIEEKTEKEKAEIQHGWRLPTQKVTMRIRNEDISVVLRALARSAGQNIVMNQSVKGKVSIDVKETPWKEVFLSLLGTGGLTYRWEGDIIRVMTLEDLKRDGEIEKIQKERQAQRIELKAYKPLYTTVVRIRYADAESLAKNLRQIIGVEDGKDGGKGIGGRASVTVDEHNNAIVLHASREDTSRMMGLIDELDRSTPQILIKARIVETSRETARDLGIQWGGLYHTEAGGKDYWITPGANTGGALGSPLAPGIDPSTGMASDFPADLALGDARFTLGLLGEKVGEFLLDIQLSALEEDGKLEILSNPSISTLDNQAALIESGREVPFQTINEEGDIEIEWKKAALVLEVTPHVVEKEVIKLEIDTRKDELDFRNTIQGYPTVVTKNAKTNVLVRDGETTVIGGLREERTDNSDSGVPWIKDTPVLGHLFKRTGRSKELDEVLIFITPHILKRQELVKVPPEKEKGDGTK